MPTTRSATGKAGKATKKAKPATPADPEEVVTAACPFTCQACTAIADKRLGFPLARWEWGVLHRAHVHYHVRSTAYRQAIVGLRSRRCLEHIDRRVAKWTAALAQAKRALAAAHADRAAAVELGAGPLCKCYEPCNAA